MHLSSSWGHEHHPHLPPGSAQSPAALTESCWERKFSLLPLPGKPCLQLLGKRSCILLGAPGSGQLPPSGGGMARAAPLTVPPRRFCVFLHFPGLEGSRGCGGSAGRQRRGGQGVRPGTARRRGASAGSGGARPGRRRPRRCRPLPTGLLPAPGATDPTPRVPTLGTTMENHAGTSNPEPEP